MGDRQAAAGCRRQVVAGRRQRVGYQGRAAAKSQRVARRNARGDRGEAAAGLA